MLWHRLSGAKSQDGIAFISSSSGNSANTVSSLSIPKPSGAQDGDLLIAVVRGGGNTVTSTITPGQSGWAAIVSDTSSGFPNPWYVFSRNASSDPSDYSFTRSATNGTFDGVICLFRGGSNAVNNVGSFNNTSGTSLTAPSITPSANGLFIAAYLWNGTPILNTPPSLTALNTDLNNDGAAGTTVVYSGQAVSGVATGNQVLTISASENWAAVQISLE
jgi:hypothetical protein